MPPAKRAPRSSAAPVGSDPTPEVSGVAKAAAKKTASKAPAKRSATRAPARATPAKATPAKAAPAKARAAKAAAATPLPAGSTSSRVTKAARSASGAAAQTAGSTAVRVGKAVGSVASGVAGRAEHAAETAEKVVAQVRPSRATPTKRSAARTSAPEGPAAESPAAESSATESPATGSPAADSPAPEVEAVVAAAAGEVVADASSETTASDDAPAAPSPAGPSPATPPPGAFRGEETTSGIRDTGRALRKHLRRQDLGAWNPSPDRTDPIELISATNADRLPSLLPLRWTRMLESPFAYLRGAAVVMAADLAGSPTTGLEAQICGDAHIANFGSFGARERQQLLDVNDFDESVVGPWEFDVKRLAASIVLAGRAAGAKPRATRSAASGAVRAYREVVHALADLPVLAAWSASLDGELAKHRRVDDRSRVLKAMYGRTRKSTSVLAAQRLATRHGEDGWRFSTKPPELTRLPEAEAATVVAGLEGYAATLPAAQRVLLHRFRPAEVALRVGGLGSIGLRTYVVLLHGNDGNDPLVLQVKEARTPTIGRFLGRSEPERQQGERIVAAQLLMQTVSDPLLGWTRIDGREFLVRQFRDTKGSVDATRLRKDQVDDYGRLSGALLARAHCRSLDPRLLSGYLGTGDQVDEAMADFAVAYADQTERDHRALVKAADAGRVPTV